MFEIKPIDVTKHPPTCGGKVASSSVIGGCLSESIKLTVMERNFEPIQTDSDSTTSLEKR